MSDGLKEHAQAKGWWKADDGEFDFAKVFADSFEETKLEEGDSCNSRQLWGTKLLQEYSQEGNNTTSDLLYFIKNAFQATLFIEFGDLLITILSFIGTFSVSEMFKILRDEKSGICMSGSFVSTGSQVRIIFGVVTKEYLHHE